MFWGPDKAFYRIDQDSGKNFHLVEPSIFCKFSKLFFPARPSEGKTRDSDIIPFHRSDLGHLHEPVVV